MAQAALTYESAAGRVGEEVAVTDWLTIEQGAVDQFAESTRDLDWMHIDPARAERESPFGGTIVFGFQTLSMLSYFSHQAGLWPDGTGFGLNYGLDRVRFMAPVLVGKRVRARFVLKDFSARPDGGYRGCYEATVEIEGEDKPAMVADWIGVFYPEGTTPR